MLAKNFLSSVLVWLCGILMIAGLPWVAVAESTNARATKIAVVNYPLQYFAERIAGEFADVVFSAPRDVDPAFWRPDAETVADYQAADLILLNGAGYAKWLNLVTLPRRKLVNTSADFKESYIKIEGELSHSHGPTGEHAHQGTAFTTWIDFALAAQQAAAITEALSRNQGAIRQTLQDNLAVLRAELMSLDQKIKAIVAKDPEKLFIGSHPVYQYLSRGYGLKIKSVHWEPDRIPSERQWAELRDILQTYPAKWMIWEGKPVPEIVDRLARIGVKSVVFDPCANVPDKGDFLDVMRNNIKNLERAYQ